MQLHSQQQQQQQQCVITTKSDRGINRFLILALQVVLLLHSAANASATKNSEVTTITQTSKNTYHVPLSVQQELKDTIYNTRNNLRNQHLHYQQQAKAMKTPIIQQEDLPIKDPQSKWQSLNPEVEFIPAEGVDPRLVRRFLEQGNDEYAAQEEEEEEHVVNSAWASIYKTETFAYGNEEYDEYQQAWRLLGFIIDCNPMVDDDYYANEGGGSGDQGTEDGCARYVLWAAVSLHILIFLS
jgi:hypothetical protein